MPSNKTSKLLGVKKNNLPVYTVNPIHRIKSSVTAIKTAKRNSKKRRRGGVGKPIRIRPRPLSLNEEKAVRKISNNLEQHASRFERAQKAISDYESGKMYKNKPFWAYNIMAEKLLSE